MRSKLEPRNGWNDLLAQSFLPREIKKACEIVSGKIYENTWLKPPLLGLVSPKERSFISIPSTLADPQMSVVTIPSGLQPFQFPLTWHNNTHRSSRFFMMVLRALAHHLLGLLAFRIQSPCPASCSWPWHWVVEALTHLHLELSESWRQKVEWWFPRAWGQREMGRLLHRYSFRCTWSERILKMNSGYVVQYSEYILYHWSVSFKMINRVNFMFMWILPQ